MRRWLIAACLFGFATPASAGDFDLPTLRGSSPFIPAPAKYPRWAGVYFGGQVGQSSANMNFAGATEDLIAYLLRTTALENEQHPSEWGVLGKANPSGQSYGGFVGYNWQWSDAVVGFDIHYNRGTLFANAPVSPITRVVAAGGNTYLLTINGDASMRITDFGAVRVRGGWAVNHFLPYATLGVAIGRADVARSAQVVGVENPPGGYPTVPCDPTATPACSEFSFASSEQKKGAFIYGWSAGAGVDVMVMPNFFLRGEYEYLLFANLQGIEARIHTGRVGAGIKF